MLHPLTGNKQLDELRVLDGCNRQVWVLAVQPLQLQVLHTAGWGLAAKNAAHESTCLQQRWRCVVVHQQPLQLACEAQN